MSAGPAVAPPPTRAAQQPPASSEVELVFWQSIANSTDAADFEAYLAQWGSAVPAKPRWLLAIPDAIRQLEALDRDLLTRRDIERLFGVSKVRAVQLMTAFGAGRTGHLLTLPRAELLRQLRRQRRRAAFRREETRREKVVTEIRRARLTGIRVAVPVEALDARLSGLPDGVTVEPDRIEVRFSGAKDAVGRLYALARALVSDYERFEALAGEEEAAGGGGEVTR